jgi:tellurite resistance protein
MSGFLTTLRTRYHQQLERNRNRPFLRATMAASALVAMADGKVTFSERVRIDQILETLEALKVFDPHEGVNLFNEFADAIRANSKIGRAAAVRAIEPVAGDPETAALILRICLAISEADGEVDLIEQIEIVTLCSRLGLEPKDCGLYIDKPMDEFLAGRD